jgi:hypothetical protein
MAQYTPRTFSAYDPSRELVASRTMTLMGADLTPGDPISLEAVSSEVRRRLWLSHYLDYKEDRRPTPEELELPEDLAWMNEADGVSATQGDNGWYTIQATWLGDEGEKVHGAENAQARITEIREKGDTKGVTATHTGGGWYEVKAPWLDDAVKVKGKDAADVAAQQLITDGKISGQSSAPPSPPAPVEEPAPEPVVETPQAPAETPQEPAPEPSAPTEVVVNEPEAVVTADGEAEPEAVVTADGEGKTDGE